MRVASAPAAAVAVAVAVDEFLNPWMMDFEKLYILLVFIVLAIVELLFCESSKKAIGCSGSSSLLDRRGIAKCRVEEIEGVYVKVCKSGGCSLKKELLGFKAVFTRKENRGLSYWRAAMDGPVGVCWQLGVGSRGHPSRIQMAAGARFIYRCADRCGSARHTLLHWQIHPCQVDRYQTRLDKTEFLSMVRCCKSPSSCPWRGKSVAPSAPGSR